jgi:Transglutaminase-like superfamily
MSRNSLGLTISDSLPSNSPEALLTWLRETPQLDFTSPKIRILGTKLTQLHGDARGKAVAVHDYVKSLPFGCIADFNRTKASDVVKLGYGDCHTKGLLFVALLRALGVPSRLRFVTLPTQFLRGLIDTGAETMVHAIGEVYLDNAWYQTDTYVVDQDLSREARELLRLEQRILGYGVHAMGDQNWQGQHNARAQCTPADPDSLPLVDWGVSHDPSSFYADEKALKHSLAGRVKWMVGAQLVNRKADQIRQRAYNWVSSMPTLQEQR